MNAASKVLQLPSVDRVTLFSCSFLLLSFTGYVLVLL